MVAGKIRCGQFGFVTIDLVISVLIGVVVVEHSFIHVDYCGREGRRGYRVAGRIVVGEQGSRSKRVEPVAWYWVIGRGILPLDTGGWGLNEYAGKERNFCGSYGRMIRGRESWGIIHNDV